MVDQTIPFFAIVIDFLSRPDLCVGGFGYRCPLDFTRETKTILLGISLQWKYKKSEPRAGHDEKWGQGLLLLLQHLAHSRHEVTSFWMGEQMSRGMGFMEYDTGWSRCSVLHTLLLPAAFLLPCLSLHLAQTKMVPVLSLWSCILPGSQGRDVYMSACACTCVQ